MGEQAGYLMPEPEGDTDFAFTGALEDYPEDWLETGPRGGHAAPEQPAPLRAAGNHGGSWRSSRDNRTPSVVLARQVPLLPCLQGSAAEPGARDQQARGPVGRGAELRDDPAGVERAALDEWRTPARFRPTSASSSASPTIGRTPRSRRGISTIFCSCRCCAPQRSPRFERKGRRGLPRRNSGAACSRPSALPQPTGGADRNGCWIPRSRGPGLIDAERTLSRVIAYRVWADQRRGWRFTNPSLEELGLVRARICWARRARRLTRRLSRTAPTALRAATPDQRQRGAPHTSRHAATRTGGHSRRAGAGRGRRYCQCFPAEASRAMVDICAGDTRGLRPR